MKFLLIESAGSIPVARQFLLDRPLYRIGRRDSDQMDSPPDIDLAPDLGVSRQHAVLRREGGKFLLEDSGSRHGTRLCGKEIRAAGPVLLAPFQLVMMGASSWMICPADRWNFCLGALACSFKTGDVASLAQQQERRPLFDDMIVIAGEGRPRHDVVLRIQIPGYSTIGETRVPALAVGESATLLPPRIVLDTSVIRRLTVPAKAAIRVECVGYDQPSVERPVQILGFWDWSYQPAARRSIAAFVSPQNPSVEQLVSAAQLRLPALYTGQTSFRSLLKSDQRSASAVLQCIYDELATNRTIHYVDPRLGSTVLSDEFQTIRPPHKLLPTDRAATKATCLDLAALFAAALEHIGLAPLIVFLGMRDELPRHALIACWEGPSPRAQAIHGSAAALLQELAAGRLAALECTGICHNESHRLSFADALRRASNLIERASWISAVDIAALRPPHGVITPLENPFDPETAAIYDQARALAVRLGAAHVESAHLLVATISCRGEVTQTIMAALQIDPLRIRHKFEAESVQNVGIPGPTPTQTVMECQQLAEIFAREAGSPSVREQDVHWALLQKSAHSRGLRETARRYGLELDRWRQELAARYPAPSLANTQSLTIW